MPWWPEATCSCCPLPLPPHEFI
uniref:Uncharacterized protein n=1 Tax=Arundo donax TaxID=35708 RepID=A0A0A8Z2M6_ARUDO